jgi:hypothetical protein
MGFAMTAPAEDNPKRAAINKAPNTFLFIRFIHNPSSLRLNSLLSMGVIYQGPWDTTWMVSLIME